MCAHAANDSLMIQCEDCETWQHAECMGFTGEQDCPDVYFCVECAPKASGRSRSLPKEQLEGPWTRDDDRVSGPEPTDDADRDTLTFERAYTPPPQSSRPAVVGNSQHQTPDGQRTPPSRLSTARSSVRLASETEAGLSSDDELEVTPSSPSLRELHHLSGSGGRFGISRPPYWSSPGSGSPSSSRRKVSSSSSPAAAALLAHAGASSNVAMSGSPSSTYGASRQLLMAQSQVASPLVRAGPCHPLLTPTKATRASTKEHSTPTDPRHPSRFNDRSQEANNGKEGHEQCANHADLPLPEHYTALLALHSAVERALLLHLATEGSRAGALVASSSCSGGEGPPSASSSSRPSLGPDEVQVDLPNLVTYTQIKAVVERGAGKRFGPLELGQLVWLWEGGLDGPFASEAELSARDAAAGSAANLLGSKNRRGGLSLSVSATRQLDKNTGKRVYTWGLGLDLRLKANVQLPAFEVLDGSSTTAPRTPARSAKSDASSSGTGSPASAAAHRLKRQGMSVLPLWSSKAESRKREMRRRLGACVAKAHDNFVASVSASSSGGSPSKKRRVHFGGDEQQHGDDAAVMQSAKISSESVATHFRPGFILDALPPIPSATLPHLGPARFSPIKRSASAGVSPSVASVDAALARADTDQQTSALHQREPSNRKQLEAGHLSMSDRKGSSSGGVVILTPEKRQSSLMERIKAKEAERQAAAAAAAGAAGSEGTTDAKIGGRGAGAQSVARNSLEAASARAKKRQQSQGVGQSGVRLL